VVTDLYSLGGEANNDVRIIRAHALRLTSGTFIVFWLRVDVVDSRLRTATPVKQMFTVSL